MARGETDGIEADATATALALADARFHSLAFAIASPVLVIGADNCIRFANPAAERLLAAPGASLVGTLFELNIAALRAGSVRLRTSDGRIVEAVASIAPTLWDGRSAWLASFDVHEAASAARRVEEAVHALRSRFLAHVSHEVRTPLNSIMGFADLLAAELFGPLGASAETARRYSGYVADIQSSSRKLLALTDDLLELARMEAGNVRLQESLFDLTQMTEEIEDYARALAGPRDRGATLRLAIDAPLMLHGDRARLRRALGHLAANGMAHAKHGGGVEIAAATDPLGRVQFCIRDDGDGFSAHALANAFAPFRPGRDPDRADVRGGLGVGLALARRTFEWHGGSLRIESGTGEPARVTAILPERRVMLGGPARA